MFHAYQLMRTAMAPISEDLATTVKFLRLLEQIEHKDDDLRENERKMLLARLDDLRVAIGGGGVSGVCVATYFLFLQASRHVEFGCSAVLLYGGVNFFKSDCVDCS